MLLERVSQRFSRSLDTLSANPQVWNVLRWVVEDGFRGEREVIARELEGLHTAGAGRVLDLGCGTGAFASSFPPERYVGVDPALHYVRYAARTRAGAFAAMNGAALGFRPHTFAAALVLGVLHHLPDPTVRTVAAEVWRVLEPRATLLVMEDIPTPNRWNLPGRAMHWLDRGGYIRSDSEYLELLSPLFVPRRTYTMRSGICDYAVYVLERA